MLRASAGVTAIVEGGSLLGGSDTAATFATGACGLLALACGLLLVIGFFTPLSGTLVGLGSAALGGIRLAADWVPVSPPLLRDDPLATLLIVVVAAAVVLLGPGAWSLDAYLFGRREIVIPHESRRREP